MRFSQHPIPTAAAGLFALGLLAWYLTYSFQFFNHNDMMYAATAVSSGLPYVDVHFVQAPGSFWFLRGVAWLAPEGHVYTSLRVASVLLLWGSVVLLGFTFLRTLSGRVLFFLACAGAPPLLSIGSEIGNYTLALFWMAVAMALWLRPHPPWRAFLAGMCIGLLCAAKLNHVLLALPLALPFLVASYLSVEQSVRTHVQTTGWGLLGVALGALPLWFALAHSFEMFWLHNVTFHSQLTPMIREELHGQHGGNRWRLSADFLLTHGPAILLATCSALTRVHDHYPFKFLVLLAAASLVMGLQPDISHIEYFAPASACILLLMVMGVEHAAPSRRRLLTLGGALIGLVLFATAASILAGRLTCKAECEPGMRDVVEVNRQLRTLLDPSPETSESHEIFTLSGALAVDGGHALAPFSEAGIFWTRLRRAIDLSTSAGAVRRVEGALAPWRTFSTQPPHYVLTGYYPDQEADLARHLHDLRYTPHDLGTFGRRPLVLWRCTTCPTLSVME